MFLESHDHMASMEKTPNFKHYCKVCKKGFMCGRALGGHMRAHGIGGDHDNWDSVEGEDNVDDDHMMVSGEIRVDSKSMYRLRTNPNRFKSCRACENCGKEFSSWKSFLDHGKCNSDDVSESLVSSPDYEGEEEEAEEEELEEEDVGAGRSNTFCKRKRTLRSKVGCPISSTKYTPNEEDDLFLAKCLVQLANTPVVMVEAEESSASASREEEERQNPRMSFLDTPTSRTSFDDKAKGISNATAKGMFECKACKKVFNSHQALGGHRASHKKVKGCFASKQDENNATTSLGGNQQNDNLVTTVQFERGQHGLVGASRKKSKVHECSICHRVFTSGQALGGHKRCHWITSNAPPPSSIKFHNIDHPTQNPSNNKLLDLNVPAWAQVPGRVQLDPRNPLSYKVSSNDQMNLQTWIGHDARNMMNNNHLQQRFHSMVDLNNNNNNKKIVKNEIGNNFHVEDEADSDQLKLAKSNDLHNLKDEMGNSGNSSPWLQVGIGTTTESAATATTTITVVADT